MNGFDDREIALLDMALSAVIQATTHAVMEGNTPPEGMVEALRSTYDKLQSVIDLRNQDFENFNELAKLLTDVEVASHEVISNPDTPINEYN
jgi:hypothetical protein